MIDNLVLLITGTLHKRKLTELLKRCHPLGWFEGLPVLAVATNAEELYHTVLVETPLGMCRLGLRVSMLNAGQPNTSVTA